MRKKIQQKKKFELTIDSIRVLQLFISIFSHFHTAEIIDFMIISWFKELADSRQQMGSWNYKHAAISSNKRKAFTHLHFSSILNAVIIIKYTWHMYNFAKYARQLVSITTTQTCWCVEHFFFSFVTLIYPHIHSLILESFNLHQRKKKSVKFQSFSHIFLIKNCSKPLSDRNVCNVRHLSSKKIYLCLFFFWLRYCTKTTRKKWVREREERKN